MSQLELAVNKEFLQQFLNSSEMEAHSPEMAWKNYVVIPVETEGFCDRDTAYVLDDEPVKEQINTLMARHCIRVNRTRMMVCLDWKKSQTKSPVVLQFAGILEAHQLYVENGWACPFDSDSAYAAKLPFKGSDIRPGKEKNSLDACNFALQELRNLAMIEFELLMQQWSDVLSLCEVKFYSEHFSRYVSESLCSMAIHWNEKVPTFIAYPFYCQTLFDHVVAAEGDTYLWDMDFQSDIRPTRVSMDDSLSGFPFVPCYSAICLSDRIKHEVCMEGGALQRIEWDDLELPQVTSQEETFTFDDLDIWDGLDCLDSLFSEVSVDDIAFDLEDVEEYL